MEKLEIRTRLQIAKPAAIVYEAIVDPSQMSNYFISESSGRMEAGKELVWKFPEFDVKVPVRVKELREDNYISYGWDGEEQETLVEMTLEEANEGQATVLTITEKSANNDEKGLRWLKSNTEGWANFSACLKAWLEYGVNLRAGAYDFMKNV
jgi:uncharacterized protein YndB with AHSA1/START domain